MSTRLMYSFKGLLVVGFVCFWSALGFGSEEVNVTDSPTETSHLQLTMVNSYKSTAGQFNAYGDYSANPDPSTTWNWNTNFSINYRFERPWEVGISFSGRDTLTSVPTGASRALSFGYPSVQGTYHTNVNDWFHLMPHASFGAPWKFSDRHQTGDPTAYADDSSSSGGNISSYSVRAGFGVLKRIPSSRFKVASDVSMTFPFAQEMDNGMMSRKGHSLNLSEGVSYQWNHNWGTNLGFKQTWGAQTVVSGVPVDGTASRLFSTSLGVSFAPTSRLRLSSNFETCYPFYQYAANQSYSPTVSLGVSYIAL